jgi:uncharacterized membrane protein YgaE (UPF0421/DUF939 family)
LTAVILTQMSVGKSVKATIDYSLGTLGGAIYAGLIAVLVPHPSDAAFAAVLAIAITPLALLAAMSPRFAAAPSTAVIVVLAPTLTHATSLASAADRVLEVALGGSVALAVSLLVFPTRARKLVKDRAADMLDLIADILPDLFLGFTQKSDADAIRALQRSVGAAFSKLDSIRAEAKRRRLSRKRCKDGWDRCSRASPMPPSSICASARRRSGQAAPLPLSKHWTTRSMRSRPKSRCFAGTACCESSPSRRWSMFSR